jgi:hypothetical protein
MATPNRSVRLSDEAMEFLDGLRVVYGSHDKGILAISRRCTPEVLALDVTGPVEESVELSKPEMIDSLRGVIQNIETCNTAKKEPEKLKARAESVAEKRIRLEKEHAAELAESDVLARLTGREDIEYDLDNVGHRSALVIQPKVVGERHHYDVRDEKVKPLARPHGQVEAKRRREQA